MTFSLIIVNYHTYQLVNDCLTSFWRYCQKENFETILVDNDTEDQELEKIKQTFGERIHIIANQSNLGFGKANNQGAKLATGNWLFFVNSDTRVENDLIEQLEQFIRDHPRAGIVAPQLLDQNHLPQIAAYGSVPNLTQIIKDNLRPKRKLIADKNKIDWVSGAALLIKKEIFEQINGWDEKFFMYLEDTDLCWRSKKLGYEVALCETAKIIHIGGQSFSNHKTKRKYYFTSQNYFFRKHYGKITELIMRLIRLPYKLWCLKIDTKPAAPKTAQSDN